MSLHREYPEHVSLPLLAARENAEFPLLHTPNYVPRHSLQLPAAPVVYGSNAGESGAVVTSPPVRDDCTAQTETAQR